MPGGDAEPVERISAVTLLTTDMAASVAFYESLGFHLLYGGAGQAFTSFRVGTGYLNVQLDPEGAARAPGTGSPVGPGSPVETSETDSPAQPAQPIWGRVVLWVDDVDAMYDRARAAGIVPEAAPADAPWGERYFHVRDPDGHELSFARPLG